MTTEQETLLLIRGQIASLPENEQKEVAYAAQAIRTVIRSNGVHGLLAMALVGAEYQNEDTLTST